MKYSELVEVYEKISSTTKRLEKTYYVSEALKNAEKDELELVVMLLRGNVFPAWEKDKKLGFSNSYVIKAVRQATGASESEINKLWVNEGDLGLVAEKVVETKKQKTLFREELSVKKVAGNIRKLPEIEGSGSVDRKVQLVSELLSCATPKEAKYIVRTVLEVLRVGMGSGTMRDAIAWACLDTGIKHNSDEDKSKESEFTVPDREKYNEKISLVESAYEKINDFAHVATLAREGEDALKQVDIIVGRPMKVMLAQKVETIEEGFEKVGTPAELEYKYDGFRMQICKSKEKGKEKITLFTRRMEDITHQFPEVVEYVKLVKGSEFILDAEAVGYDARTKKYLPFQKISQRIKRKYSIKELSSSLPIEVNVFDILYHEGKSCLKEQFKKRRELIEKIVPVHEYKIRPAHNLVTQDMAEAAKFYKSSSRDGFEGIMLKSLESPYKPGSRVGHMVKLKPTMETLDLAIVGAEWGEGKRSGWLTSLHLACIEDGEFKTIGKVGTGIKELKDTGEVTFEDLTDLLKPLIIRQEGRVVEIKPEIIVEVRFEEIQQSPRYTSNYALRFPRVVRLREDRGAEDASTLQMVKHMYREQ